jgi:TolB-like protein/Flp pilus assembly protein TadD
MKAERWKQINDLFQSATECPPKERAAFLDQASRGDEGLRREVESLLTSYERAENFIESPAFEVAPELLTNDKAGALVGALIGHYRVESLIGIGGMGEVYLARDERLGRKVALKLLPERLTADETQLSRFKTEARAASALNHPNILTVYEIGVEGNRHFIATEFIEGITLRTLLARGRMNLHDALEIAVQVASALSAAHEAGVVHRDIKPENIMLRPDGYAKVLDFGIAKLTEQQPESDSHDLGTTTLQTQPGLVLGTARYMSPEQARGQKMDARSDIWSLGVVIYEMVGGIPPFAGETPSDCIASILKTEPPSLSGVLPDVPVKLQSIVQKALRKNRDERYQTIKEMLADLRRLKEVSESITSGWKRQRKITVLLAASVAVALVIAGLFIYVRPTRTVTNTLAGNASPLVSVIPEKSVAVLPFKNLSADQENARFADGMQDEILTDLARISDLKVISRTSVMQYKSGIARNLREIGQQLGVAHLLEGSVQRAANRVRVNAKLIDARTDAHLWAQTYDRDLADVFAIQSEIAKAIADQLQARLSPNEKAAIEKPPTADLAAFDLYTRAKTLLLTTSLIPTGEQNLRQAVELLNQAVTRDPAFFEAYYQLAFVHGRLYSLGFDHTANRLASAEAALQAAIRLRPDAGETHLARANYLYYGPRDYAGALAELENARQSLPNHPRLFELTGYILRRRGQQEEGLRNLEKALELDPRNSFIMQQIALSYQFLRRYPEEAAILDRALTIIPNDAGTKVNRAVVDFYWKADTKPLHQAIDSILAGDPGAISQVADSWFVCALAERDRVAAERALVALGDNPWLVDAAVILSRSFGEGLLARVMKDEAKARAAFSKARAEQEKIVQAQPDYGPALCVLGLIDAALGRKEAALEEARRAIELLPVEKDSINGSHMIQYFAITAAWTGEKDLALQQLELGARAPTPSQALNYGALKLLPFWDPLRGDPRFEKIVASLGPKEAKPLSESHASPSQAPAQSPTEKSIAVLPFTDLSKAHDQEYFCDGIQEEILTRLSKVADLKVISRTSTQRYKSTPENLPEIAKQLGVANILEGTLQQAEGQVRVNVQLINAKNDSHLWGEKYDRNLTDVFGVESEIAKAIADTLAAIRDESLDIDSRKTPSRETKLKRRRSSFS